MAGGCSGSVIILHGAPHSGKHEIQAAIVDAADAVWYTLGVDALCQRILSRENDPTLLDTSTQHALSALHVLVSSTARHACNLVVDHAFTQPSQVEDMAAKLQGLDVIWAHVRCPRELVSARQAERGMRVEGDGPIVHDRVIDIKCDIVLDGSANAKDEALRLLEFMKQRPMIREPLARVADPQVPGIDASTTGHLIILSGTSSAGKTTLATALQEARGHAYLQWGLDAAYMTLGQRFCNLALSAEEAEHPSVHPEGWMGADNIPMPPLSEPAGPRMWQRIGPALRNAVSASYAAQRALLEAGWNVISDQVFYYEDWYAEARRFFEGMNVTWVYVFASPEALISHEKKRGDRVIGVSLGLLDQMYKNIRYDVEIDTTSMDPAVEAQRVLAKAL